MRRRQHREPPPATSGPVVVALVCTILAVCVLGVVVFDRSPARAEVEVRADACGVCGGSGRCPCSHCGGRGSDGVRVEAEAAGEQRYVMTCSDCGGQGTTLCPWCGGSGKRS